MMTVPTEIAKKVLLDKLHPIAAWRMYLNISPEKLAELTGLTIQQIQKLENSNEHLKANMLVILARAFDIHLQALNYRYNPHTL